MVEAHTITVEGMPFQARFAGFGAPLRVVLSEGREVALAVWTLGDHLAALRECLSVGTEGLSLDAEAFSGAVLAKSGLSGVEAEALGPLCLWWAAGGGVSAPALDADGWADLGSARARLRSWTEGERQAALRTHLSAQPDGALSLDVVGYLEAMLDASVLVLDPSQDPRDCDAAATASLLGVVTALNVAETPPMTEADTREVDRALATQTLRICRALGWTPSQVWGSPAAEIKRIAQLLDLVDPIPHTHSLALPHTPARSAAHARGADAFPGHSSIALQPDAIVIQVEEKP